MICGGCGWVWGSWWIEGATNPSPFSPCEKGELKGVYAGECMNPLRLAALAASPFC